MKKRVTVLLSLKILLMRRKVKAGVRLVITPKKILVFSMLVFFVVTILAFIYIHLYKHLSVEPEMIESGDVGGFEEALDVSGETV